MLAGTYLGHYHLLQRIGGGGMGEIYLAEDTQLMRQVAIKVIRSDVDAFASPQDVGDAQRLFQREMRAITKLDHPYILPLYDFGEQQVDKHLLTYMVMPYRSEGSLNEWLQKRGTGMVLPATDVAHFIGQAAEALQQAHDHGLIHQDVKPANFLVRNHPGHALPDLLLADFGIARVSSNTTAASQSMSIRGTPTYMAPEQWEGHPLPATDQYALAIMAYILLTGHTPFSGRLEQVMHQHFSVQPAAPSTFNSALSGDLDRVVLTALEKDPQKRFGSVSAFARAFQQAVLEAPQVIPPGPGPSSFANISMAREPGVSRPPVSFVAPIAQSGSSLPAQNGPQSFISQPSAGANMTPQYPIQSAGANMTPQYPIQPADANPTPQYPMQDGRAVPISQYPLPPSVTPPISQYPVPPAVSEPVVQSYNRSGANWTEVPYSNPVLQQQRETRPRRSWAGIATIIGLIVLVIVASIVGLTYYGGHQSAVNATATANAQNDVNNQAQQSQTATASAIHAQQTATASSIDSQATSVAESTAQAITNNPYPAYMTGSGKLFLIDPLSKSKEWSRGSDKSFGGDCSFQSAAYHASETKSGNIFRCESNDTFSNFALEVRMNIVQGDCGGVTIRASDNTNKLYYFRVCADGNYAVFKFTSDSDSTTLAKGTSNAIDTSNNGTTLIGILANGADLKLYINQQKQPVAAVNDASYTSGTIDLCAEDIDNSTEVAYQNMRIWK